MRLKYESLAGFLQMIQSISLSEKICVRYCILLIYLQTIYQDVLEKEIFQILELPLAEH